MPFLDEIKKHKTIEIAAARQKRGVGELKRMIKDAPPVRSFYEALSSRFGLIAEIKWKSPSAGNMRAANVKHAEKVYSASRIVNGISVLTDNKYFGMSLDDLLRIKGRVRQPVLRKDFILDEYQVYEARAYGADAVLLMANVLQHRQKLKHLYEMVRELGMDALFEVHTEKEIDLIPDGARICGINSRNFTSKRWKIARQLAEAKAVGPLSRSGNRIGKSADPTIDFDAFRLIKRLPADVLKVAESGISPKTIKRVQDSGFQAALVGTSLLQDPRGVASAVSEFEQAISPAQVKQSTRASEPVTA